MKPKPETHRCPECAAFHYSDEGRAQLNKHFATCAECGEKCGQDYMVKPEVWIEAGMSYHGGVLHLDCLAKRLERPLTLEDFAAGKVARAINATIFLGFKIGQASQETA